MNEICSLLMTYLSLSLCGPQPPQEISGYVEGDYITVSPVDQAAVRRVLVTADDRVKRGQVLAELDTADSELSLQKARAGLQEANAVLANLKKGQRTEEINALEATLASWEAEERRIAEDTERTASLFQKSIVSKAENDKAQAALLVVRSRLEEAQARLAIARLPARPDEVAAQEERVAAAEAALRIATWQHAQRTLTAETGGTVETVIRHPGELAGPAAPVLSLLPDGAIKVKFYVSAEERVRFGRGRKVALGCRSCPEGLTATVSRIGDAPEFTPPVIYSIERSQRLMYLVEARPDADSEALQPGQIVSVRAVQK